MQQIFRLFSVFARLKVTINENVSFKDHGSGIRLPDCSKLAINRKKMTMTSQFDEMTSSSIFLDVAVLLLPSLVSGPTTIFLYWSLTGNRKYPHLSLVQYLETGKFGIYVTQLFLMKCFWTEGKIIHPPFQIRVNETFKRPTTKELM